MNRAFIDLCVRHLSSMEVECNICPRTWHDVAPLSDCFFFSSFQFVIGCRGSLKSLSRNLLHFGFEVHSGVTLKHLQIERATPHDVHRFVPERLFEGRYGGLHHYARAKQKAPPRK